MTTTLGQPEARAASVRGTLETRGGLPSGRKTQSAQAAKRIQGVGDLPARLAIWDARR